MNSRYSTYRYHDWYTDAIIVRMFLSEILEPLDYCLVKGKSYALNRVLNCFQFEEARENNYTT